MSDAPESRRLRDRLLDRAAGIEEYRVYGVQALARPSDVDLLRRAAALVERAEAGDRERDEAQMEHADALRELEQARRICIEVMRERDRAVAALADVREVAGNIADALTPVLYAALEIAKEPAAALDATDAEATP